MLQNAVVKPPGFPVQDATAQVSAELLDGIHSRLQTARAQMLMKKNWSFFGYLSMHLERMAVAGLGTCATDGDHFLYDPVVLSKEPLEHLTFDWAHELMHLIGMDLSLKPLDDIMIVLPGCPFPVSLWNLACDLYNNLKLEEEGFAIPHNVPIDKGYKGMSKDEIYEDLKKKVKKGDKIGGGSICGGLRGKPKKGFPSGPIEKGDVSGWKPSKADKEKWLARSKEALGAAKMKGYTPGFAESAVTRLMESQVPWRDILWPFCVRSGKEWRYNPPSRTGMAREIILPRLCPEMEIDHGVFIFDTSGSIDDTILTEFCSELEAILNTVRMKVTVLMVDAKVHEPVYHFEPGDFNYKALKFLGRGGTAFEPAFEWVEEQGITPTFMVYFTDTYGSFPDAPPDYPVLWAVTHPNGTVPWGEYLCMKEAAV